MVERLRQDIALLEKTEGYAKLTDRQQKIIRVSLYLQARAERDMCPGHKNDPWYYDWLKGTKAGPTPYAESLKHIKQWYCHVAIASLESGDFSGYNPPDCPHHFFDGTYFEIRHLLELQKAIEFFGFPCIVHVSSEMGNEGGETSKYHTFLALGHDEAQNIIIWEKIRIQEPYRLVKLNQVYEDYHDVDYWGFRKIRPS